MKKTILSGLIVLVFTMSFSLSVQSQTLSDISGHTYEAAIQELVDSGVINGYADGTFKPDNAINRAEFLKIVIGAFKSNVGSASFCFPDVKTEWFAKYICYGKANGIIQGYPDSTFQPAKNINYVEALKMLYQANNDDGNAFGNEWYSRYLDDAMANNLAIKGLDPAHLMKRGEIAQLVSNYASEKEVVLQQVEQPPVVEEENPATGSVGVDLENCNSAQISGNALYVATSGNDSNDGTMASPKRTVLAALDGLGPHTTVVLSGGTYNEPEELRIRSANVTLRSMPGEWAVIDRSADTENAGVYFYVGSDGGKLQCIEVKGGFYTVSTETMWDWGEADRSGTSDILIEDSKLHGAARDVIKIKPNSDRITIRRNEIYDSGMTETPGDCNAEGIDNVNGDSMLVQNNHIHDTCSTGVYFKGGATNGVVEGNLIENTGGAGVIVGFDTSPEFFDLAVNPDYYENMGGIVRDNLIKNAGGAGIALYASKNAQVYNNTIIDSASVYHSPIYLGVTFQDWEPEAGRPANLNPTIRDNVVYQSASLDAPMVSIRYSDELGGLSGLSGQATMSGNCYYRASGEATFEDGRSQMDVGGWTEDWGGNLSEWKGHMNTDGSSLETNPGLNADFEASGQCAGKGYSK